MATKSSINILQEYCISKFKKYPEYQIRDIASSSSPLFTVECHIANVCTSGVGSSKIAAKTAATDAMLVKLGITNPNHTRAFSPIRPQTQSPLQDNVNSVGLLNEFCSKKGIPYPEYVERMQGGRFLMECRLQGQLTTGLGANKKEAKKESARAMYRHLLQPKSTVNEDIANIINLDPVSIHDSSTVSQSVSSQTSKGLLTFQPPKGTDSVSTLNLYCDKYKFAKPEYFECGKVENMFTTKCKYQSLVALGKGLTTKFAKQDSALNMLKLIGIEQDSTQKSTNNDQPAGSAIFSYPSSSLPQPRSDTEIIDIFKQLPPTVRNLGECKVEDLISFDDYEEKQCKKSTTDHHKSTHPELHQALLQHNVKYDLEVMQSTDPCIVLLRGKRLMQDGTVVEKYLMEMGDRYKDLVGTLLHQAVEAFDCAV